MKGRTAAANALAQFLRDLTAEYTVSQLAERYQLSRSVWSEYRSGLKIIPLHRLNRIIEDRFPRDARTRSTKLQEARRLHSAAMTEAPSPTTVPAPSAASPSGPAQDNPAPSPDRTPTPAPANSSGEEADLFADNPPTSDESTSGDPNETPQPASGQALVPPSKPGPHNDTGKKSSPAGHVPRGHRWRRWRAPAQWAALAILVAVLIIANRLQNSNDQPETAPPLEVPEQVEQSTAPAEPSSLPTGPMAPAEVRPTPASSSASASSKPKEAQTQGGKAGIVVATSSHLYRITPDGQAQEYTGKATVWTVVRKGTERIFTSPTTLYATDGKTGNIEQYDHAKKTWTVIGGPGSHFAATATHLYGVGTLGTMEYSGTPGVWHQVRGTTERIFTSPTTLYATDGKTGNIEQYDRTKKTWTVIGGPGSHFAATATHLYGVGPDHKATFEYSGTPGVWHPVRGSTDRIFTSPTTLYATDTTSGKLQEYNRSKKTWTVIGDPVDSFVSTKDRLYAVNADRSNVYEYSSTPETWSPIGSPRH
ncbi:hypothetical protein ACFYSH_33365 [Streptomyces sp. NPDC005791]|uniref:hypothetical protein n=1 Tax=Streptomyces sp. NPDC005791 TaxID=3364732 RepID=UPI0036BE9560